MFWIVAVISKRGLPMGFLHINKVVAYKFLYNSTYRKNLHIYLHLWENNACSQDKSAR